MRNFVAAIALSLLASTNLHAETPAGNHQALSSFFGEERGDYIIPGGLVVDQFGEALSGPPNQPRTLADGTTLISGCRLHSCVEKGAVVVNKQGELKAAGLIHFSCAKAKGGRRDANCSDIATFTLFVPRKNQNVFAETAVIEWAHEVARDAVFDAVTLK